MYSFAGDQGQHGGGSDKRCDLEQALRAICAR